MRRIVSIEGIIHSGKSTLVSALEKDNYFPNTQFITEYCEFIGGGQNFPGFPKDTNDALKANNFFSNVERQRFSTFNKTASLIILDRSILSVLAYHYATEKISQGNIQCFNRSVQYFEKHFPELWPSSCIYLAIDFSEMQKRHGCAGFYENILLHNEFNCYLIEFYSQLKRLFPEMNILEINGKQSPEKILLNAKQLLIATAT